MDGDILMMVVFCLFLLLFGVRLLQHNREEQKQVNKSKKRMFFTVVRLLVLGGLLLYMVWMLWGDLNDMTQIKGSVFFLRCLIFVITIYILILGVKELFWCKGKRNTKKQ